MGEFGGVPGGTPEEAVAAMLDRLVKTVKEGTEKFYAKQDNFIPAYFVVSVGSGDEEVHLTQIALDIDDFNERDRQVLYKQVGALFARKEPDQMVAVVGFASEAWQKSAEMGEDGKVNVIPGSKCEQFVFSASSVDAKGHVLFTADLLRDEEGHALLGAWKKVGTGTKGDVVVSEPVAGFMVGYLQPKVAEAAEKLVGAPGAEWVVSDGDGGEQLPN